MYKFGKNESKDRTNSHFAVKHLVFILVIAVLISVFWFGYRFLAFSSDPVDETYPDPDSISPEQKAENDSMLKGVEGTLEVGKPIKIRRTIAKQGTTSTKVKVIKGYYNIRTKYDNGSLSWVLYDGDTVMASQDSEDNPGACFDIRFKKTKYYNLTLKYEGTERCKYTIDFETSVGPYWPEKYILDMNKGYPNMTYRHVFRYLQPDRDKCISGEEDLSQITELKCTLIFTESEFGEIRSKHRMRIQSVRIGAKDLTRKARIRQRKSPERNMWDITAPLPGPLTFSPAFSGLFFITVELKDEDNHVYHKSW